MGIFVAGMHRSGTSAVAGLLHHMGGFTGSSEERLGADPFNPAGYWERIDVFELHERVLQSAGATWNRVRDFSLGAVPRAEILHFEKQARAIIAGLGTHAQWSVKDPRLSFLFPLWRAIVHRPVCVLVHRHPARVAASLERRNGFAPPFGLALWERYMLAALASTHGVPRILVSYDALLADPIGTARRLQQQLAALGCIGMHSPTPEEAAQLIDASLDHESAPDPATASLLNADQRALHALLETGRALEGRHVPAMSAGGLAALQQFENSHAVS